MPSLWLLEMRRVAAQRRLGWETNNNHTSTALFDQFILRMGNDDFDPNQSLPHNILMQKVTMFDWYFLFLSI